MYNEDEIPAALRFRDHYSLLQKKMDDESELISVIKFSNYTSEIIKPETKKYRDWFLDELDGNGIDVRFPEDSDDGKWHFILPAVSYEED
ncbi:hypothetical protein [Lactiplantibacillus paraxiangfangensis]|uniref:hypothetical protein n=1 Tax=Lactiplantibacillus paraxiangfangensis TaxID=3076224 RepID=UPI0030C685B5